MSLPIALAFIVFGREILALAFGQAYAGADLALAILALGQLVNAGAGSVGILLIMSGNQRRAASGVAFGAGLNVVLGVLLIPPYGVNGAAVAAAAGLVLSNLLLVDIARRTLGIHSTALGRIGRRQRKGVDAANP